jgi:pectin methylesterase-like acyl-CoA thioesterase
MPRINNKVVTFATIAWGNASMTEGSPLPMELSAHQNPAMRCQNQQQGATFETITSAEL